MQKIKSILLTVLLSLATTAMMAATTNPEAVTNLLNRIGGGQTLITCCEDARIAERTGGRVLTVENGVIR